MDKVAIFLALLLFCLFLIDGVSAQEIKEKGILFGLDATKFTSHPLNFGGDTRVQIDKDLQSEIGWTLGFYFVF